MILKKISMAIAQAQDTHGEMVQFYYNARKSHQNKSAIVSAI